MDDHDEVPFITIFADPSVKLDSQEPCPLSVFYGLSEDVVDAKANATALNEWHKDMTFTLITSLQMKNDFNMTWTHDWKTYSDCLRECMRYQVTGPPLLTKNGSKMKIGTVDIRQGSKEDIERYEEEWAEGTYVLSSQFHSLAAHARKWWKG